MHRVLVSDGIYTGPTAALSTLETADHEIKTNTSEHRKLASSRKAITHIAKDNMVNSGFGTGGLSKREKEKAARKEAERRAGQDPRLRYPNDHRNAPYPPGYPTPEGRGDRRHGQDPRLRYPTISGTRHTLQDGQRRVKTCREIEYGVVRASTIAGSALLRAQKKGGKRQKQRKSNLWLEELTEKVLFKLLKP